MLDKVLFLLLLIVPLLLVSHPSSAQQERNQPKDVEITFIEPPEAGFYSKQLYYGGIPIKAHEVVADEALFIARDKLEMMLRHMPNAVKNLVDAGSELHIIGKNQVTSDLPEHRFYKGKPYEGNQTIDQRTRGVGGILASCGEENLLQIPGARYDGQDICVHEFAHNLQDYGLSRDVYEMIEKQHKKSLRLWRGSYAGSNVSEFFAELSMWYWGTRGDPKGLPRPIGVGRRALALYDPESYDLIDGIYSGRIPVSRKTEYANPTMLKLIPPSREKEIGSEGETPTMMRIRNRTAQDLIIYWLPGDGTRKYYDTVRTGTMILKNTFAGHAWLATTANGKGVAIFVAAPRFSIAEITERKIE